MYELIYRSVARPGIGPNDISNILNTSRSFNALHNITGCLLFHNGEFIQILEGNKLTVQALFSHIQNDNRHSNVILLEEDEKEERMFPLWSMAYFDSSNPIISNADKLLFKNNFITAADIADKPTPAISLFWHMGKVLLQDTD
jgi:hypothetical protein